MKICLYSPYLPNHFGGGEKYLFDVANTWITKNQIDIAISNSQGKSLDEIKSAYIKRFGPQVEKLNFVATPLGTNAKPLAKLIWTARYDVLYHVTDGSLFFSWARKNILHIQIPFTNNLTTRQERLKLNNWQNKNTNSNFTKKVIEKHWQTTINNVVHPGIDLKPFNVNPTLYPKEKIILSVGRFFRQLHSKRQDIMVNFFKNLCDQNPTAMRGWKLVLVGQVEDEAYARQIAAMSTNYPIEIIHQINNQELQKLYLKSSIYWHATGFETDDDQHPEKQEHFGISTVEAMAAGCVPVVINRGGQPEILGRKLKDCLWSTERECHQKTLTIITKPKIRTLCQEAAKERAKRFSLETFEKNVWGLLKNKKRK